MRLLSVVIWLSLGLYGAFVYLKRRTYIRDLSTTRGNQQVKRTHTIVLAGAVTSFVIALWQLAKLLNGG